MYKLKRRFRSQHFLVNRELIHKLIRASSIGKTDHVLDIGAGSGALTQPLLAQAGQVTAIEIDRQLSDGLRQLFSSHPNLHLVHGDFLSYPLPTTPFKVFANIPFSLTGDIIRRLLNSSAPLQDCYLIVQSEAAAKFVIHPGKNTLASLLYHPYWDIRVIHKFARSDFSPLPSVDCVLLKITSRSTPLIPQHVKNLYQDYLAYHFSHNPFATYVSPNKWLSLFIKFHRHYSIRSPIPGSFTRLQSEQARLSKIHRSRTYPKWKNISK